MADAVSKVGISDEGNFVGVTKHFDTEMLLDSRRLFVFQQWQKTRATFLKPGSSPVTPAELDSTTVCAPGKLARHTWNAACQTQTCQSLPTRK